MYGSIYGFGYLPWYIKTYIHWTSKNQQANQNTSNTQAVTSNHGNTCVHIYSLYIHIYIGLCIYKHIRLYFHDQMYIGMYLSLRLYIYIYMHILQEFGCIYTVECIYSLTDWDVAAFPRGKNGRFSYGSAAYGIFCWLRRRSRRQA